MGSGGMVLKKTIHHNFRRLFSKHRGVCRKPVQRRQQPICHSTSWEPKQHEEDFPSHSECTNSSILCVCECLFVCICKCMWVCVHVGVRASGAHVSMYACMNDYILVFIPGPLI